MRRCVGASRPTCKIRLGSASVTGKLRLGENASIGPTGRTQHSADASDPPCLLHPGAGVRGVKAGAGG